ncbi:TetR/AcrR family transcriptional regulator [Paenibacillus sp. UNC451MF]|uniref:TetR/AcrR family transcriptional regulator n=1 Tax=Paenibacillus sp. UNC451MF TaxID=1449063 RepID=UPI00048F6CC3|nr:TetR/AcrR family transcriptional regulator [Paenibacillus sp. UNC451MF]
MPRNVERDQEARKERCEQILSVAVELFAKKGLDATKISDIAAKVGISHGLVYNYFQSKEEIYASLINKNLNSMRELIEKVIHLPVSPLEKLKILVDHMLKNKWEDALFHQIFVDQMLTSESIAEDIKASVRKRITDNLDTIAEIFAEGQRKGELLDGNPKEHALFIMSCIRASCLSERQELYVKSDSQSILHYFQPR